MSEPMTTVVIAEPDQAVLSRLVAAAGVSGATDTLSAPTLAEALDLAGEHPAAVVVAGPGVERGRVLGLAARLAGQREGAVVLVASDVDADLLRDALRAGVTDVASVDDGVEDIAAAIARGLKTAGRMRAGIPSGEEAPTRAKVMTVFSTKGGVGKTVLATNLGVAIARDTGARVALVDLDLEFGDVAIMLGLEPQHTIFDAVQVFDRLDADMLSRLMQAHGSGVRVLLAPLRPEEAESISAARVGQVLDLVRDQFDYVVVDTSPSFSEAVLAALDRSDEVYVVTMMDVASIKNTRISLQKLTQLGYDNGRIRLVLNRSDSKVLLEPVEVERVIGGKVTAHIPSDRIVPRSVNRGVPVVLDSPKSEVAKAMATLAKAAAIIADKEV